MSKLLSVLLLAAFAAAQVPAFAADAKKDEPKAEAKKDDKKPEAKKEEKKEMKKDKKGGC